MALDYDDGVLIYILCIASLRKCFSFGYVEEPPLIQFDNTQLKVFAEEAEDNYNLDLASKLYMVG
jgi:hypothetical protein